MPFNIIGLSAHSGETLVSLNSASDLKIYKSCYVKIKLKILLFLNIANSRNPI